MDRFKNIVVGVDLAGREHLVSGGGLGRFSKAALEKAVWLARRNACPVCWPVISTHRDGAQTALPL